VWLVHGGGRDEPVGNVGEGAGLSQVVDGFDLLVGRALPFGLEFKREAAAVVDRDHVRNAGLDAEALQDRRLDRLAIAAVGGMEGEHPGSAASAQVLKHCPLNRLLWTRALHDTSSGSCSRSSGAPTAPHAEPSRVRTRGLSPENHPCFLVISRVQLPLSDGPPIPARARRRPCPHSWPTPSLPCRLAGRRKASTATSLDTCCPRRHDRSGGG